MARILVSAAGAAASGSLGPSWLFGLCVFIVSVWVVSFTVFICSYSHQDGDGRPKKKPAPVKKVSRVATRSFGTMVDTSGMYVAAYAGCSGGGHHHGGGGCGGDGHHGGCGYDGGGGGGDGGGCGGGGGGGDC